MIPRTPGSCHSGRPRDSRRSLEVIIDARALWLEIQPWGARLLIVLIYCSLINGLVRYTRMRRAA